MIQVTPSCAFFDSSLQPPSGTSWAPYRQPTSPRDWQQAAASISAEESCQKCTPCRIGNRALHHVFEELAHGEGSMTREKVDEWLLAMEKTSICGLGQASPFPVRNAMRWWPELFTPLD